MANDTFRPEAVGQIMIPVQDLERATTFYRDVLGLPFLFEVPGMSFFEISGLRLMLGAQEEWSGPSGSILYFRIDDIHGGADALRDRGVVFDQDPTLVAEMDDHDLWMAFFPDCEGNQLALMAEVGKV